MKYKITIQDLPFGWVKNEETKNRARLFELREQAHANARDSIKKHLTPESAAGQHFVYYYEMPETFMGKKTGNVIVRVYFVPYMCDDKLFFNFVDESKPDFVGAIHGNNLCSKFFK